jgi:hypothetical protein
VDLVPLLSPNEFACAGAPVKTAATKSTIMEILNLAIPASSSSQHRVRDHSGSQENSQRRLGTSDRKELEFKYSVEYYFGRHILPPHNCIYRSQVSNRALRRTFVGIDAIPRSDVSAKEK